MCVYLGLARTGVYLYLYGIFGREITKYTVIYDVYIRFWPTLLICILDPPSCRYLHTFRSGFDAGLSNVQVRPSVLVLRRKETQRRQ